MSRVVDPTECLRNPVAQLVEGPTLTEETHREGETAGHEKFGQTLLGDHQGAIAFDCLVGLPVAEPLAPYLVAPATAGLLPPEARLLDEETGWHVDVDAV